MLSEAESFWVPLVAEELGAMTVLEQNLIFWAILPPKWPCLNFFFLNLFHLKFYKRRKNIKCDCLESFFLPMCPLDSPDQGCSVGGAEGRGWVM